MALGQHQKVIEGLANEEDQLKLDLQVLGAEIELLRQRQAALFLRRVDNSSAAKVRPSVSLIATGIPRQLLTIRSTRGTVSVPLLSLKRQPNHQNPSFPLLLQPMPWLYGSNSESKLCLPEE